MKITMLVTVMVSAILLAVMVAGYANTYRIQEDLVRDSLDARLTMGSAGKPQMGMHDGTPPDDSGRRHSSLLTVLLVNLSEDGIIMSAEGWEIEVDTEALWSILERAIGGEASGHDLSASLAWDSRTLDDGTMDVAVVDISSPVKALRRQAYVDCGVFVVAIVLIICSSWLFSDFATHPIMETWDTQRQFVSDASHELKTPLAVIVANMDVMARSADLTDDGRRWVASTKKEAGRMSSLISDMLELSRSDEAEGLRNRIAGGDAPSVNLSDLVEEAIMETDAMAFERGHQVEDDIEQGVSVRGDAEKLSRAIRILIDNATKYGAEGTPVAVSLSATKRHARIAVHNEGKPMTDEAMAHAFDRFYRSDKARTFDDSGSGSFGLGLSIAKSISELHGGRISVESAEGAGTTFTIILPLDRGTGDKRSARG